MGMKLVEWHSLRSFIQQVFTKAGIPEGDALILADAFVFADMRGVRSHGIERMPNYLERVEKGLINKTGEIRILSESPSTLLVDACNSLGSVACVKSIRLASQKVKETGCVTLSICHSNHFGAAAYYTNMIAEMGMVGFTCTGATADVAPWGSYERYLGTNPFSISVPTLDGIMNLDMATSVQAKGKLRVLKARGEKVPEGWCLDKDGNPTTDPDAAIAGTMLPMGGPKGYGMAAFIDILGGVLSGSLFGKYAPHFVTDMEHISNVGHFFYILDISHIMPLDQFKRRLDIFSSDIKSLPKREGFDEIYLPGEIEARKMTQAKAEGISIDDIAQARLKEMANKYDVISPV